MVYKANLDIVATRVLSGEERARALRRKAQTLQDICKRAGIECRVTGGPAVLVSYRMGGGHGQTIDDRGQRRYVVDRSVLPQRDPERAVRELEVLAYLLHDYAARESVCNRGIFVYPLTPEHGRAWLAEIGRLGGRARTQRKARASRRNGKTKSR